MSPYGHTLKGKKSDKDEIRIRLGLGALMSFLGPKEGAQGGGQGSPPKGLYKQRKGAPKTLIIATIHAREPSSSCIGPIRSRGSSNPECDASSRTCGLRGGAVLAA